ncbi:unnamed protein product [Spirodela intermedia]|uniref:K-box domain-containing protein n=1 Tax=Spirodela intermedia TaxID=51605 RepID=A0A7I8I7Z9_SPIIN|nr:unnamed protein product [Spirodela intermedia]CAA6653594.1 unnamed protein product [Spirodela intermedia]
MLKTLEKYQKCSYPVPDAIVPSKETQSSYQEYLKLKGRVEALQRSHSKNLLYGVPQEPSGEDLGSLNTRELEQLENQLDASLKHVRSTKTQLMLDQLCDLRRKEQMLQESNRILRQKVTDLNSVPACRRWAGESPAALLGQQRRRRRRPSTTPYGRQPVPPTEGLLQPLGFDGPLQIGWYPVANVDQLNPGELSQNVNGGFVGAGWDDDLGSSPPSCKSGYALASSHVSCAPAVAGHCVNYLLE